MTYFLQNTFNDLFDDIINTNHRYSYNQPEVINSKLETKINIEVPGFKKENLNLKLEKNILSVSGEQKEEGSYKRSISRSFSLNDDMDPKNIKAAYEYGILSITIPKKKTRSESREIKIT